MILQHPDYGPLTVGDHVPGGRSRECIKEDGSKVILSSKAINALERMTREQAPIAPEDFVASVALYLRGLNGTVKDATTRNVWEICDRILEPARYAE